MTTKLLTILFALLFGLNITAQAQQGLKGEYFNGQNFEQKVMTRTDARIDFVWDEVSPAPGMDRYVYSIRWTGKILAPETGTYVFRAHVDDGIRVMVAGKSVINAWDLHDSHRFTGEIYLQAGQHYTLQVDYFNGMFEGEIQLYWQLPSEAPVFKGLLGYNDKLIDGKFFSLPGTLRPINVQPKPAIVERKPTAQPVKKPAAKPASPILKPARLSKDTLEKYVPRNILFVQSKSIMLPESEPELDRLAGFLLRNPKYSLSIDGHTDRIGNAAKNLLLSEKRAQAVAAYLIRKGIAGQRITSRGYGDTRPLVRAADGIPNEINRRVEFVIQE